MKKSLISIMALICAIASLVMSCLAFVSARQEPVDYSSQLSQLEQKNQQLQTQIDALHALLETQPESAGGLYSWKLDVTAWDDGTGADIALTAVPDMYQEELSARFVVQLEGQEIIHTPCVWNGESFTATASLSAADGYGYCLLMDLPDGTQLSYTLTTPNDPVQDIPVYLASSLSSYCNLIVDAWEETEEAIVLNTAYAQVQLPRISAQGSSEIESACLVLTHNGAQIHTVPITLLPGEALDGYELTLSNIQLPLPETAEDDLLELRLEVTLSTGQQLLASGISWFRTGEELYAVVG